MAICHPVLYWSKSVEFQDISEVTLQGDTSGRTIPPVDIKTKVAF